MIKKLVFFEKHLFVQFMRKNAILALTFLLFFALFLLALYEYKAFCTGEELIIKRMKFIGDLRGFPSFQQYSALNSKLLVIKNIDTYRDFGWVFTHHPIKSAILLGDSDLLCTKYPQYLNTHPYVIHSSIIDLTFVDTKTLPCLGQYKSQIISVINNENCLKSPPEDFARIFKEELRRSNLNTLNKTYIFLNNYK
jgi:hypothetical protein